MSKLRKLDKVDKYIISIAFTFFALFGIYAIIQKPKNDKRLEESQERRYYEEGLKTGKDIAFENILEGEGLTNYKRMSFQSSFHTPETSEDMEHFEEYSKGFDDGYNQGLR